MSMALPAPAIREHPDAEAMASAVAGVLADAIQRGVTSRGDAWLALAGGSTPFAAYRRLAAMDLPWPQVHVVASDERWVPAQHERRNERALAEAFTAANGVTIHPLVPAADSPVGTEADTGTATASLAPLAHRAFDAVLLGMGTDAHFASLFPRGTPAHALLTGHADPAVAVLPDPLPPEAPFPRVSLTLSRLLDSHHLLLMISGATKRDVLDAARAQSPAEAPIHALLAAAPHLAIHWSP